MKTAKTIAITLCTAAACLAAENGFGASEAENGNDAGPMLPGYLTDVGAGAERVDGAYVTPKHLRYPYAATYYVEPTVKAGDPVKIGYYVTDWNHSRARLADDSARFDVTVRYSRDCTNWLEKTARNVKAGDGEFDLGALETGEWTLSLQATDRGSALPSGIVWHDFRVVERDFDLIPGDRRLRVTDRDLAAYGILRLDRDYERLVGVPMEEDLARSRKNAGKRIEAGRRLVDAAAAAHPDVDAETPGYAVYVPTLNGIPVRRAFEMLRIVRDRGYDTNAVAVAATATRSGLQRLLDEKRAAGFRKVTLPRGVYRVDSTAVVIPPGLTLDLGGSTVKLNGFAGCRGKMFAIRSGRDTKLENGIVEGDYYEHDYARSPKSSEWVCGWEIDSAAWYCEVRDVVTRNVTGYGGCNGMGTDAPGKWVTYSSSVALGGGKSEWTDGGYRPDGTYDAGDGARRTSRAIDLAPFRPFKYLTVSKLLGYQGIRTRNWNLTVAYLDAASGVIGTEVVSQYRISRIPPEAATARFSIEVASLDEAKNCDLSVFLLKYPRNCAIRRCRFERCRAVGYAMSACRNLLMEDCDFSYSGETLATCAFDAEDGWDGMQDVTFRRNVFHDNPNNDFLTCAGHNFVYENNVGNIHLWPRTFSPCIRSNDCGTAAFACRNRNRTGYGRYEGNVFRRQLHLGSDRELGGEWNIVFDGYDFRSTSTNDRFRVLSSGTGLFRNCTFEGVAASPGAAENCTFRDCDWTWARYCSGTIRDCTFENCRIPRVDATNLYERCAFKNVTFVGNLWNGQYFRNCTLENFRLVDSRNRRASCGVVTDCTLKGECSFPAYMRLKDNRRED